MNDHDDDADTERMIGALKNLRRLVVDEAAAHSSDALMSIFQTAMDWGDGETMQYIVDVHGDKFESADLLQLIVMVQSSPIMQDAFPQYNAAIDDDEFITDEAKAETDKLLQRLGL